MFTTAKQKTLLTAFVFGFPVLLTAAPPVVKAVPWVAANPLIPHDTYSGRAVRVKGTSDIAAGANNQYFWDCGNGSAISAPAPVNSSNQYGLERLCTYTGPVNTVFTATLTVQNLTDGTSASKQYFVAIRTQSLAVEVNIAIDEGLWYMHKTMTRTGTPATGTGRWDSGFAGHGGWPIPVSASNTQAFEVNGHLETSSADNPYTETVQRGMRYLFSSLIAVTVPATQTNPSSGGPFSVDGNGNGYAVKVDPDGGRETYQDGMLVDAIIASNTPNAVTTTGPAAGGGNPGILGRTYRDILQDLADRIEYCQNDAGSGGAWDYTCNQTTNDNSISQWDAIGLIPVQQPPWNIVVHKPVKDYNKVWLTNSQAANGTFGYNNMGSVWGPYGTTPSGMVQMAMDGIGRGNMQWDKAETFYRDNFANGGTNSDSAPKAYYYGMYSFTKSMLLHNSNGDNIYEPIVMLESKTPGTIPIDWYRAEANPGAPIDKNNTDGFARKLVNDQNVGGYWTGHNSRTGDQFPFETGWAVIMLKRELFTSGSPVAVPTATPNPAVALQTVNFSGSLSYHEDPTKSIVKWEWDLDNNGSFETVGVTASRSFPAVGNYPVTLRVTDNFSTPATATSTITVVVGTPPLPPTAEAGGPYLFCTNRTPWFLNGAGSTNPDQGQHQPGAFPGDTIIAYEWDLDSDSQYDDATGAQPNVTAQLSSRVGQSFLVGLKVTDNTAASFPASGQPNLTSTDTAQVSVKAGTDPACSCISNLAARTRSRQVQLTWSVFAGAHHYDVYRGTVSGGPYVKIASTQSTYSTYLDTNLTNGTAYYYVVYPAQANGDTICQSNQATGTPQGL